MRPAGLGDGKALCMLDTELERPLAIAWAGRGETVLASRPAAATGPLASRPESVPLVRSRLLRVIPPPPAESASEMTLCSLANLYLLLGFRRVALCPNAASVAAWAWSGDVTGVGTSSAPSTKGLGAVKRGLPAAMAGRPRRSRRVRAPPVDGPGGVRIGESTPSNKPPTPVEPTVDSLVGVPVGGEERGRMAGGPFAGPVRLIPCRCSRDTKRLISPF